MEVVNDIKNLSERKESEIKKLLNSFKYSDSDMLFIMKYVAQFLCDEHISKDATSSLINDFVDVTLLERDLEYIYNPNTPPLSDVDLLGVLSNDDFKDLTKVIQNNENRQLIGSSISENEKFIVNFSTKQVYYLKSTYNAKSGDVKTNKKPVIEACPKKLVVYDGSLLDLPRSFKIVWESKYSARNFTTAGTGSGATVKEIADYLTNSGFSHNKKFVHDAVSVMINTMIKEDYAEIKDTVDNKGVYYDDLKDSLIVIDLDYNMPSMNEMNTAIDVLTELSHFYVDNKGVLSTVFKWTIVSIFNYAMKQIGNEFPWVFMMGTSHSGKTTLANIMLYVYDKYIEDTSGSHMNSEARIGQKLAESCVHLSVSEPEGLFAGEKTTALLKHCVYSKISRVVLGKAYPVFRAVIFTSNPDIPTADAIFNRMIKLSFEYNQRKNESQKKVFKEKFNYFNPKKSILKHLNAFGKFAIHMVNENTSMLGWDWQKIADTILQEFFKTAGRDYPEWLTVWEESEDIEDFDNSRIDDIRTVLVNEINRERKRVTLKDENGYITDFQLDDDVSSTSDDFKSMVWHLVNNRVFTWAAPYHGRMDRKYICLTQNFKKMMNTELDISDNLKSLSQMLDWDYTVVPVNGKKTKVIKVLLKDFVNFVYPDMVGVVDED